MDRRTHGARVSISLGVLAVLAGGFAFLDRAREEYYLWKLRSEDENERQAAARSLPPSLRSARRLVDVLRGERDARSDGARQPEGSALALHGHFAARELARMGKPAADALVELIARDGPDPVLELAAQKVLGDIGDAAIPRLIEALRAEPADLRRWAVNALAAVAADPEEVAGTLAGRLRDPSAPVRRAAAAALESFGPQSRGATAALVRALDDDDAIVQRNATFALRRLDLEPPVALRSFSEALRHPEAQVRRVAAAALGDLGPRAGDAVPALADALRDPDRQVVVEAVWALGKIGDPRATPHLVAALRHEDRTVRRRAVEALGRILPDDSSAAGALEEKLLDRDEIVRRAAAEALDRIRAKGTRGRGEGRDASG